MGRATQGVKLINIKGNDSIAAVTKVMKDDVVDEEPIIGEDGEIIPAATIERVKPVLEILEDDGADDDDDDDDVEIDDEEDDADDSDDDNDE